MKILYCAYHLDPNDPDSGSGADHNFYHAIKANGHEVRLLGPIKVTPHPIERIIKRVYEGVTRKKYLKYYLSDILMYRNLLEEELRRWTPDLIFSIFPVPFVFYDGNIPGVFRMDAPMLGVEKEYVDYGLLAKKIFVIMEKMVFRKVRIIITHSRWSERILTKNYHVNPGKIVMFPNPCPIKKMDAASEEDVQHRMITLPIRLLAVGRDYYGKGMDIAIQATQLLNSMGYPTTLTICGMSGVSELETIKFMGRYQKKRPDEYRAYLSHFFKAHLLIHATRYDASPIVTSEAAAFGLPVITNYVGGVGTSVLDGITGVVLPSKSTPEKYAEAVLNLYFSPEEYSLMALNTWKRFHAELNWDEAGSFFNTVLQSVEAI